MFGGLFILSRGPQTAGEPNESMRNMLLHWRQQTVHTEEVRTRHQKLQTHHSRWPMLSIQLWLWLVYAICFSIENPPEVMLFGLCEYVTLWSISRPFTLQFISNARFDSRYSLAICAYEWWNRAICRGTNNRTGLQAASIEWIHWRAQSIVRIPEAMDAYVTATCVCCSQVLLRVRLLRKWRIPLSIALLPRALQEVLWCSG